MKKKLIFIICIVTLCAFAKYDIKNINLTSTKTSTKSEKQNEKFIIYTVDESTYKIKKDRYINIPLDTTMEQKIYSIAKNLSENNFNSLEIEIVEVKDNILTLNLKEGTGAIKWSERYFGNINKASITTETLVETFLQKEYKGKWIKGVKFLYNGKVNLALDRSDKKLFNIHYRNQK